MRDATGLQQHLPTIDVPPCPDIDAAFRGDPDFTTLDAAERRGRTNGHATGRRASVTRSNHFEERPIELVLYVSSISPHSKTALRNIRRALAEFSNRPFTLTVHDLSKDPQRAARDGVTFTPALVTAAQGPRTWILGHLENRQVLQAFLESAFEQLHST